MGISCTFGFHTWDRCTCTVCGKIRDDGHDWGKDCEKCAKCGKSRSGVHTWVGCTCSTCGIVRDIDHDWSKDCDNCAKCGKHRNDAHAWVGCKCSKCSKMRDEGHDWRTDCEKCAKCGKLRTDAHTWGGCKCTKCGKTRDDGHDWGKDCEKCVTCGKPSDKIHDWSQDCGTCASCGKTRSDSHTWDGCTCTKCGKTNIYRHEYDEMHICSKCKHSLIDALLCQLSDQYIATREYAAKTLGELGDPRAVEPLLISLGDDSGGVRMSAARALGKLGDPRAVESLINSLGDDSGEVRMSAARALGKLGDHRAIEPLITALWDKRGLVRATVAFSLNELGESKWKAVEGKASDFGILADLEHPDTTEMLVKILNEGYGDNLLAAINTLGRLGDSRAIESLIKVLGHKDKMICNAAAQALETIGEPKWKDLVKGDSDDYKRLADTGDTRVVELLIYTLNFSERRNGDLLLVTESLETFGNSSVVELLISKLEHNDKNVRYRAAKILVSLHKKSKIDQSILHSIREKIVKPHSDIIIETDRLIHTDSGIGLKFDDF